MQIILVHQSLAQARTLTVTSRHVVMAAVAFAILVFMGAVLLYYVTFSHAADIRLPVVRDLLLAATHDESTRKDQYLRENIDAMAIKLGEMQAQVMRLEALGERVSGLAGLKPQEFDFKAPPGRGGALAGGARDLSVDEFRQAMDALSGQVDRRADYLSVVESELMSAKLRSKMMPTIQPVDVAYNASGFGWRIDPFTGQQAMHQGIDFVAPVGTPIVAAAGGVVVASEWHHDFGNMIEVDHGNDISTLYAHTSKVYVQVGDIVRRGDHIADIGTTGRSTGAHLHFEVHVKGVPQNPARFLVQDGNPGTAGQIAAASPRTPNPVPPKR